MKTFLSFGAAAVRNLILPCAIATAMAESALAQADGQPTGTRAAVDSSPASAKQPWVYVGVGVLGLATASVVAWYRLRPWPPPPPPTSTSSLTVLLLTHRMKLAETVHGFRDRARDVGLASVDRRKATDVLARHADLQTVGSAAAVQGAAQPSRDWEDVVVVCRQYANLGRAIDASALLRRSEVINLLPRNVPGRAAERVAAQARLDSGSRCLECAMAWCAIARASKLDNDAREATDWFQRAINWLPPQQDVDVLLEWAEFARRRAGVAGEHHGASGLLEQARQRISAANAKGFSVAQRVTVWVKSAECEMDGCGVPELSAPNGTRVQLSHDQAQRIQGYLTKASEVLREEGRNGGMLVPVEPYYRHQGAVTPQVVRFAPLHFRIKCASARLRLGADGSFDDCEQCIMDALGEHAAPSHSAITVEPGAQGTDARTKLQQGWSRLLSAGANLTAEDRSDAQELRFRWVEMCVRKAESAPAYDSENQQARWRDAAWLLCRYWAWSDEARLPEDAADTERLEVLSAQVASSAWNPVDPDDRHVRRELQRRLRIAQTQTQVQARPIVDDVRSAASNLAGRAFNLVCAPIDLPVGTGSIQEVRVFDAAKSGSAGSLSGYTVSIDTGGGQVVRRHGVFGYPLGEEYRVPVADPPIEVAVSDALKGTTGARGTLHELARMNCDGLGSFGPGFDVVLRNPQGQIEGRVRLDGLAVRSASHHAPVSVDLLQRSQLQIEIVLSATAVGATTRSGMSRRVDDLADRFEAELGAALPHLIRGAGSALAPAHPAGGIGTQSVGYASEWLNRRFIHDLWVRLSESHRLAGDQSLGMPREQVDKLDGSVRNALRQFVANFVRENPGALNDSVLERLGLAPERLTSHRVTDDADLRRAAEPRPSPSSFGSEPKFEELRRRAFTLALESRSWLFETHPEALRNVVSSMIDAVQNQRSASADPVRREALAKLAADLEDYLRAI